MSGDYSRIRFDPRKDIASVWMQQGRVQLDSDWNEGMAALDHRLRAESVDTFGVHPVPGRTGVAVVSPQTPDAFEIKWDGTDLTIGSGRMYVDGLLVENHGEGEEVFDPVLAELRREGALPYKEQPYFLAPSALPQGPCLVYLEVWQRELTHLQYPEMVENAVGVDTTTRWQTVWQVRFLALNENGDARMDCNTPDSGFPGWQALVGPSGGRMSIGAVATPPDTGPCELPPSGGYRGLENQLYRIEIHDGGPAVKATFKWSRDNASVASAVVEIVSQTADSTELKLASLGRDAVLRFNAGDWVEILDDRRELDGADGYPARRRGEMRRISDIYNDRQTIQFSPPLPTDLVPANNDELAVRHMRVRRWDQKDVANGLIPIPEPGVWVELEKGIQVQFSLNPDEGEFRSGDYWVSAARTADTSVETFTDAPPRGIHRHYARLAIIDFRNDRPVVVSDCRTHWPPACDGGGCCTITVAPGENIQAALDALPNEGGCVCLKTGVHNISETIQINRSNVILQGESPGVIVRSNNTALRIEGRMNPNQNNSALIKENLNAIVVKYIRFETEIEASFSLLEAQNCTRLRVTDCEFIAELPNNTQISGFSLTQVTDVTITSNRIRNMWNGITITGDASKSIDIRDNFLEGNDVNNTIPKFTTAEIASKAQVGREGFSSGIRISSSEIPREVSIRSNHLMKFNVSISMEASRPTQLVTSGVVVDGNFITQCIYGIAGSGGKRNRIQNNHIDTTYLGIGLFKESDSEISGNHLNSCGGGIFLSELNGAFVLLNNRLMNCGLFPLVEGVCSSIYIDNKADGNESPNNTAFRIDGCEIIDTGFDAKDSKFVNRPAYGIYIHGLFIALQITNNRIDYTLTNPDLEEVKEQEHRALLFRVGEHSSSDVLITNNQFRGYGHFALVEADFLDPIQAPSHITFSNNTCEHLNLEDNDGSATVVLNGPKSGIYFVLMGNQITSRKKYSLSLGSVGRAICIGNLMTGDIDANTVLLKITPASYHDFNVIGG